MFPAFGRALTLALAIVGTVPQLNKMMTGDQGASPKPFNNEEILKAAALIYPQDVLEAINREHELLEADASPLNIAGDQLYLVLATMSREYAGRVLELRPDLEEEVAKVRADPEAFIEMERRQTFEAFRQERRREEQGGSPR